MQQQNVSNNWYRGREGVSILLAIVITAVVLVIGVTVSNVVLGEITIGRTADDSLIAFYAANSGMERALLYCRRQYAGGGTFTFDPGNDGLVWNSYENEGNRFLNATPPQAAWRITGTCGPGGGTADITATGLYPCEPMGTPHQPCEVGQEEVSRRSLQATY